MTDQQYKRNVAYKLRLGELLLGKPMFDQEKFIFLELGNKKLMRVNLIGNIVERFESEGDKKYLFFTLDDGSGQIKLKVFGEEDVERFKSISQGQTVVIIGVLRNWNNETYVQPEVIKEQDSKYLLIRKLESEKERSKMAPKIEKKQVLALKDKILDKVKKAEDQGGIDTEHITMEFREVSSDIINQEIQKLLEEGILFEPKPGRLRYLG